MEGLEKNLIDFFILYSGAFILVLVISFAKININLF